MQRLELGIPIPLQTYLDNMRGQSELGNINWFINPDHISESTLYDRLIPLTQKEIDELRESTVRPREQIYKFTLPSQALIMTDDITWMEIFDYNPTDITIWETTIDTSTFTSSARLVFIHALPNDMYFPIPNEIDEEAEYYFGWVTNEELEGLCSLAVEQFTS